MRVFLLGMVLFMFSCSTRHLIYVPPRVHGVCHCAQLFPRVDVLFVQQTPMVTRSLGLRSPRLPEDKRKQIKALENKCRALQVQHRLLDSTLKAEQAQHKQDVENIREAAKHFRSFLAGKYAEGTFASTDFTEICWHLVQCGLSMFGDLALSPETEFHAKNSSRLVRKRLGMADIESSFGVVSVPVNLNSARTLCEKTIALIPDLLAQELTRSPQLVLQRLSQINGLTWENHEVRKWAEQSGHLAIPFGIFVDATPWKGKGAGNKDSTLSWFVNIAGMGRRRTVMTIRKDHWCGDGADCPCRGRCTTDAIERCIRWQGDVAAVGVVPEYQYGNMPWTSLSVHQRIGENWLTYQGRRVVFCILQARNDWDQLAFGWGTPRHNQAICCPCGPCRKEHLRGPLRVAAYTHETYLHAVRSCQIILTLDQTQTCRVFDNLIYDHRITGMHGRAVARDIDVYDAVKKVWVTLCKFDRLELHEDTVDTHENSAQFKSWPARLCFWRCDKNKCLAYVSHLFFIRGFKFEMLGIDVLHCLDLGVCQRLIGHIFVWVLRQNTVFGIASSLAGMKRACSLLEKSMNKWYGSLGRKVSKISKLNLKTLGYESEASTGELKCKGMQSRHLLIFARRLLNTPRLQASPELKYLKISASALLRAYAMMSSSGWRIDAPKLTKLLNCCVAAAERAGVRTTPKFHVARHLGPASAATGNPARGSCHMDEDHNKTVVRMARAASVADFGLAVVAREKLLWAIETDSQEWLDNLPTAS